tara:strand:- start:139 stop:390 length:252 start_codon:yes stop_codon:yes gene_type:complete
MRIESEIETGSFWRVIKSTLKPKEKGSLYHQPDVSEPDPLRAMWELNKKSGSDAFKLAAWELEDTARRALATTPTTGTNSSST